MKTSIMRHAPAIAIAVAGALTLSAQARAEPVLEIRCNNDSLAPDQARARLDWAWKCGVPNHVDKFDTLLPSSNGAGTLIEYIETVDFWGANAYSGTSNGNQINDTFTRNQFYNGPTSQVLLNGFKRWTRSNLLPRPTYPTFGDHADIGVAKPLYPHPQLATCKLYRDKFGAQPIEAGKSFYVNAYCVSSCYTPEQEILFPEGYKPILDAMNELRPEMVTLAPSSTLTDVKLTTNPVHSYTRELHDSTHIIFEIRTGSGGLLRVTDRHPVILGNGKIVEARTLKAGDRLVRPDGSNDPIVSVTTTKHQGKVYNIRPSSKDRVSNILVAQGYLVGSSAYQNEDVDYMNRVILGRSIPRDVIPTD